MVGHTFHSQSVPLTLGEGGLPGGRDDSSAETRKERSSQKRGGQRSSRVREQHLHANPLRAEGEQRVGGQDTTVDYSRGREWGEEGSR